MPQFSPEPVVPTFRYLIRHFGFWLGVVFLGVALFIGWLALQEGRNAQALARDGIDTTGRVTGLETERRVNYNGRTSTRHLMTVAFRTQTGEARSVRLGVAQARLNSTRVGDTVALRYSASDPGLAELDSGKRARDAAVFGGFAAVLALLALVSFALAWRGLASLRRALAGGERRRARIESHSPVGRRSNAQVQASWTDSLGGKGTTGPMKLADAPAVGIEIEVRIDPRTGRGWWTGDPSLAR